MINSKPGHIFIIIGPPGAGKGTLVNKILEDFPQFVVPSSYTTRPPRSQEGTKKKYIYVENEPDFMHLVDSGKILEYVREHGNLYGTSRKSVDKALENKQSLLLEIEPRGADLFKKMFPKETTTIFISPPSLDILKKRMLKDENRKGMTAEELATRMKTAENEMPYAERCDHILVNEEGKLEQTYKNLVGIIEATE